MDPEYSRWRISLGVGAGLALIGTGVRVHVSDSPWIWSLPFYLAGAGSLLWGFWPRLVALRWGRGAGSDEKAAAREPPPQPRADGRLGRLVQTLVFVAVVIALVVMGWRVVLRTPDTVATEDGAAETQEELADATLDLEIIQVAPGSDPRGERINLLVFVAVSNSGAPTSLSSWDAFLGLRPSGSELDVAILYLTQGNDVNVQYPDRTVRYTSSDMIYHRAAEPIERGGRVVGMMPLILPGGFGQRALLEGEGLYVRLEVSDAYGQRYEAIGLFDDVLAQEMPPLPELDFDNIPPIR